MALSWSEFESSTPDIASAAKRLMIGPDGVAIAFIAWIHADQPNLAPICPVFSRDGLYLIASDKTPKSKALIKNRGYALHAFLGENDEEIRISGTANLVSDQTDIARVQSDIPFPAFDRSDPIFHLGIASALWVYWEHVGTENTKPIRKRWNAKPNK